MPQEIFQSWFGTLFFINNQTIDSVIFFLLSGKHYRNIVLESLEMVLGTKRVS